MILEDSRTCFYLCRYHAFVLFSQYIISFVLWRHRLCNTLLSLRFSLVLGIPGLAFLYSPFAIHHVFVHRHQTYSNSQPCRPSRPARKATRFFAQNSDSPRRRIQDIFQTGLRCAVYSTQISKDGRSYCSDLRSLPSTKTLREVFKCTSFPKTSPSCFFLSSVFQTAMQAISHTTLRKLVYHNST